MISLKPIETNEDLVVRLNLEVKAHRKGDRSITIWQIIQEYNKRFPNDTATDMVRMLGLKHSEISHAKNHLKLSIPRSPAPVKGFGAERIRKRKPTMAVSTSVKTLFHIMDAKKLTYKSVGERAGMSKNMLSHWRSGKMAPTICNLEAVLEVIGYKLEVVKDEIS